MRKNLFLIDLTLPFKVIENKRNENLEKILLSLNEHFMQALGNVMSKKTNLKRLKLNLIYDVKIHDMKNEIDYINETTNY
jgi:hypothetical protein